jgi:hypothetical protein
MEGNCFGLFNCTAKNLSEGTEENLSHVRQPVELDLKVGPLRYKHVGMMFACDINILYLVFLS